jgi:predicted RNA binding protein YcfA (HicA-like mRNA interferase family)
METEKNEGFKGESDLTKAVKLLEENGFYVVHADAGQHIYNSSNPSREYTGAILIQAYPKRTISVSCFADRFVPV